MFSVLRIRLDLWHRLCFGPWQRCDHHLLQTSGCLSDTQNFIRSGGDSLYMVIRELSDPAVFIRLSVSKEQVRFW